MVTTWNGSPLKFLNNKRILYRMKKSIPWWALIFTSFGGFVACILVGLNNVFIAFALALLGLICFLLGLVNGIKKRFVPRNMALVIIACLIVIWAGLSWGTHVRVQKENTVLAPSEISTWKTYTDTKNGFEIKYPQDWFISQNPSGVSFSNTPSFTPPQSLGNDNHQNEASIGVVLWKNSNKNGYTLDEWYTEVRKKFFGYDLSIPTSVNKIDIGGVPALKEIPHERNYRQETYIMRDADIIWIHNSAHQIKFSAYYDQIISTLKFIPIEPTIESPVAWTVLLEGADGGNSSAGNIVVRNSNQQKNVWAMLNPYYFPKPNDPYPGWSDVNFSKNTVVALFSGQKETAGYSVAISKVEETPTQTVVTVQENSPDGSCNEMKTITHPFYIASLSYNSKPIVFNTHAETFSCR